MWLGQVRLLLTNCRWAGASCLKSTIRPRNAGSLGVRRGKRLQWSPILYIESVGRRRPETAAAEGTVVACLC
jgi:hypothetical protein